MGKKIPMKISLETVDPWLMKPKILKIIAIALLLLMVASITMDASSGTQTLVYWQRALQTRQSG